MLFEEETINFHVWIFAENIKAYLINRFKSQVLQNHLSGREEYKGFQEESLHMQHQHSFPSEQARAHLFYTRHNTNITCISLLAHVLSRCNCNCEEVQTRA